MSRVAHLLVIVGMLVLMVGAGSAYAQEVTRATAELKNAQGQVVGTATFTQQQGGVQVSVQVQNLPPGLHGIHIHAVGQCNPPEFTSAGGHFNPTNKKHGLDSPEGAHAGDLPNLNVAANGTGTLSVLNPRVTVSTGDTALIRQGGTALVVHANPDDLKTDPAGNAGARIACGVIQAAAAQALPKTGGLPTLALAIPALFLLAGGVALRRMRIGN